MPLFAHKAAGSVAAFVRQKADSLGWYLDRQNLTENPGPVYHFFVAVHDLRPGQEMETQVRFL
jgi:hypothetical protein